jgi:VWFA-related protein
MKSRAFCPRILSMAQKGNVALPIVVLLAALVLAFPAPAAVAAEPVTVNIASLDDSQFPNLTAVVDVLDTNALPVAALSLDNFRATVGDEAAQITDLQTAVDANVSLAVVLVVDVSGSMDGAPLAQARTAANEFVSGLSPQDTVAVLTFSDSVSLVQDFTSDKGALTLALDRLQAVGNIALYQAASEAAFKAAASPLPRKVIILLSDGVDYGGKSAVSRDDSIAQARYIGVPVYTIGLGSDIDRDYLSALSQSTRARSLETPTAEGLSQLYAEIGNLLRSQYIVKLSSPIADRSRSLPVALSVTVGGATAAATATLPSTAPAEGPQVSLTGIGEGQKLESAVTIGAEVTAANPLASVRFLVDGKSVGEGSTPPFQLSLDPAAFTPGAHTLRVEAADSTGAVGQAESSFLVAAPAGGGGGGGIPLLPLLLVLPLVVLGGAGWYLLRRRRRVARVPRQAVQVRLRPWSNPNANAPAVSLSDWTDSVADDPVPQTVSEPRGILTIVSGPGAGREFAVGGRPISIGSAGWCAIVLPDDDDRIGPEEARAWVHHSNRLIFHQLTRLSVLAAEGASGGWMILQDGDEVSVGPCRLAFRLLTAQSEEEQAVDSAVDEALERLSTPPGEEEAAADEVA